ncbi:MAG: glucose-6-phosphate dehydrogenase [Candidatus Binatia bacterium]
MEAPTPGGVSVRVSRPREEERPEFLRAEDPVTVVIFGASGDLARRKLIPALYHLHRSSCLPARFAVIGMARTEQSDEAYRAGMLQALRERVGQDVSEDDPLIRSLYYIAGDADDPKAFAALRDKIEAVEREHQLPGNRLYYLSVAPAFFAVIVKQLAAAGLIHPPDAPLWSRVIIEKPFGTDLNSAIALTAAIRQVLDESQIYRIDHYLGKETVQNILAFRFGNAIFEPLFNHRYVDHVQITVAETLGMEGNRGAYYDKAGALRDMVQNHMMQLLCLIAMEPPAAIDARSVRDEKVKVLRALLPMSPQEVANWTVRGQYGVGERNGEIVRGYRQEPGVDPNSYTETYVAIRHKIDTWRWAGVPFFLRTGKRLAEQLTEIAMRFKRPPMLLFREMAEREGLEPPQPVSNYLVLRIQPDEGISLSFACKRPGIRMRLEEVTMDFRYGRVFQQRSPEAYERLLLDALRGDQSLFTRSDEVEYAWRFVSSIHDGWARMPPPTFPNYYPFTDGPAEAERLMAGTTAHWRNLTEAARRGDPC